MMTMTKAAHNLIHATFIADWSILYVTVIIFGIIMAIGGIVWAICFCMGR